jgi:hypothetical protein
MPLMLKLSQAHLKRLYCHHNICLASLADKHTCENRHVRSMPSASKVPASAGNNHSSVLAAATAASLLRRSVCCILPFNFLSAICREKLTQTISQTLQQGSCKLKQEQKGLVDPGKTYLLDVHGLATLEFCNLLVEFLVLFPAEHDTMTML